MYTMMSNKASYSIIKIVRTFFMVIFSLKKINHKFESLINKRLYKLPNHMMNSQSSLA
jgi:hypothetical protein